MHNEFNSMYHGIFAKDYLKVLYREGLSKAVYEFQRPLFERPEW